MRSLLTNLKSDESLMLAYQNGDPGAFEVLYHRHKDHLFNFIYRSCQRADLVEDIAQDVWMSVIRAIAGYQPRAKFRTYLYQIARNRLIDHWRRDSVDRHDHDNPDEIGTDHESRHHDNHARLLIQGELMTALSRLPDEQREAFLLREEGFTQREIAEITESKQETVKSRVRYARQQLRVLLEASS